VHASAAAGQRTCIVVLGMHRSGTSALTRVLSLLGAGLPKNVLGAMSSNETGHWEPERLVMFHDALLATLQSTWHDWTALDISQLPAGRRDAIRSQLADLIKDEYGGVPLMVVKDPRICRFAPFFFEALAEAGVTPECVLTVRNPLEVAQSLEHSDGMSRGDAGLLWLRHVLDAEAATRRKRRAILYYDGLLTDWRSEIRRIAPGAAGSALEADARTEAGPELVWPHPAEEAAGKIDQFINMKQRHHTLSIADVMQDAVMLGWIGDVYDALHRLRQHPASADALATLDRVRAEFDRAALLMSRIQRDLRARVARLEAEIASLKVEAEQHAAEIALIRAQQRDAAASLLAPLKKMRAALLLKQKATP